MSETVNGFSLNAEITIDTNLSEVVDGIRNFRTEYRQTADEVRRNGISFNAPNLGEALTQSYRDTDDLAQQFEYETRRIQLISDEASRTRELASSLSKLNSLRKNVMASSEVHEMSVSSGSYSTGTNGREYINKIANNNSLKNTAQKIDPYIGEIREIVGSLLRDYNDKDIFPNASTIAVQVARSVQAKNIMKKAGMSENDANIQRSLSAVLTGVVSNMIPMLSRDEFVRARYGDDKVTQFLSSRGSLMQRMTAAKRISDLLPKGFASSFEDKVSGGSGKNVFSVENGKELSMASWTALANLISRNGVAAQAAVDAGIASRTNGKYSLNTTISGRGLNAVAHALEQRLEVYGKGMPGHLTNSKGQQASSIYEDDEAVNRRVIDRMSAGNSGKTLMAMIALNDIVEGKGLKEGEQAFQDIQSHKTLVRKIDEAKRVGNIYYTKGIGLFDGKEKEVSLRESSATRAMSRALALKGLKMENYSDISDKIITISLDGYDKNNPEHKSTLTNLYKNGMTQDGVEYILLSPHGQGDVEIKAVEKNLFKEVAENEANRYDKALLRRASPGSALHEMVKKATDKGGHVLSGGTFWDAYQGKIVEKILADPTISDEEKTRIFARAADASNKIFTPTHDIGFNLGGKSVAYINEEEAQGGKEYNSSDGISFFASAFIPRAYQSRGAYAGKGTVENFTGESVEDLINNAPEIFGVKNGFVKLGANGERYDVGERANQYVGLVTDSFLKNKRAYDKAALLLNPGLTQEDIDKLTPHDYNELISSSLDVDPIAFAAAYDEVGGTNYKIGAQMAANMRLYERDEKGNISLAEGSLNKKLFDMQTKGLAAYARALNTAEGRRELLFGDIDGSLLSKKFHDSDEMDVFLNSPEVIKRAKDSILSYANSISSGAIIDFGSMLGEKYGKEFFEEFGGSKTKDLRVTGDALLDIVGKGSKGKNGNRTVPRALTKRILDEIKIRQENGTISSDEKWNSKRIRRVLNLQEGDVIDFTSDEDHVSLGRAPTGFNNLVSATNLAKDARVILDILGQDLNNVGNTILVSPKDLKTLGGADKDGDSTKAFYGLWDSVVSRSVDYQKELAKRAAEMYGDVNAPEGELDINGFDASNPIDQVVATAERGIEARMKMALASGAGTRALQKEMTSDLVRGSELGNVLYEYYSAYVKDPKQFKTDSLVYAVSNIGKEWGKFADADKQSSLFNTEDENEDNIFEAKNGVKINLENLKMMNPDSINLPSGYMDNVMSGISAVAQLRKDGAMFTDQDARQEAIIEALEFLDESSDKKDFITESGAKIRDAFRVMRGQFMTGRRGRITEEEEEEIKYLSSSLGDIKHGEMAEKVQELLGKGAGPVEDKWGLIEKGALVDRDDMKRALFRAVEKANSKTMADNIRNFGITDSFIGRHFDMDEKTKNEAFGNIANIEQETGLFTVTPKGPSEAEVKKRIEDRVKKIEVTQEEIDNTKEANDVFGTEKTEEEIREEARAREAARIMNEEEIRAKEERDSKLSHVPTGIDEDKLTLSQLFDRYAASNAKHELRAKIANNFMNEASNFRSGLYKYLGYGEDQTQAEQFLGRQKYSLNELSKAYQRAIDNGIDKEFDENGDTFADNYARSVKAYNIASMNYVDKGVNSFDERIKNMLHGRNRADSVADNIKKVQDDYDNLVSMGQILDSIDTSTLSSNDRNRLVDTKKKLEEEIKSQAANVEAVKNKSISDFIENLSEEYQSDFESLSGAIGSPLDKINKRVSSAKESISKKRNELERMRTTMMKVKNENGEDVEVPIINQEEYKKLSDKLNANEKYVTSDYEKKLLNDYNRKRERVYHGMIGFGGRNASTLNTLEDYNYIVKNGKDYEGNEFTDDQIKKIDDERRRISANLKYDTTKEARGIYNSVNGLSDTVDNVVNDIIEQKKREIQSAMKDMQGTHSENSEEYKQLQEALNKVTSKDFKDKIASRIERENTDSFNKEMGRTGGLFALEQSVYKYGALADEYERDPAKAHLVENVRRQAQYYRDVLESQMRNETVDVGNSIYGTRGSIAETLRRNTEQTKLSLDKRLIDLETLPGYGTASGLYKEIKAQRDYMDTDEYAQYLSQREANQQQQYQTEQQLRLASARRTSLYNAQRYSNQRGLVGYFNRLNISANDAAFNKLNAHNEVLRIQDELNNQQAYLSSLTDSNGNKRSDVDAKIFEDAQNKVQAYKNSLAEAQNVEQGFAGTTNIAGQALIQLSSSLDNVINKFGTRMFQRGIQEAKQFVLQFDASMNEIKMITMKSDAEMGAVRADTINTALKTRTSIANVAATKAALYRQGLDDGEMDNRLNTIIKFSTVAGIKVESATKIMTTAMQNGLVKSVQEASDAFVALGDNAATTAEEIAKAYQKTAATAKTSGMQNAQLMTLITFGTSKTQLSGQQIGTALNTIMTRIRKVTTDNYVKDQNGQITSINDVEAALSTAGVSIRNNNNTFRGTYDILRDIGMVWEELSDTQQSMITNSIAGTRQTNIFQTLMQSISEDEGATLDEYLGLATNSTGITQSKYEIAMESIQSAITNLKNSFDQLFASDWFSGTIVGTLDTISNLFQVLAGNINAAGSGLSKFSLGAGGVLKMLLPVIGMLIGGPIGGSIGSVIGTAALGAGVYFAGKSANAAANNYENGDSYESKKSRIEKDIKTHNEKYDFAEDRIKDLNIIKDAIDQFAKDNNIDAFKTSIESVRDSFPNLVSSFDGLEAGSDELSSAMETNLTAVNALIGKYGELSESQLDSILDDKAKEAQLDYENGVESKDYFTSNEYSEKMKQLYSDDGSNIFELYKTKDDFKNQTLAHLYNRSKNGGYSDAFEYIVNRALGDLREDESYTGELNTATLESVLSAIESDWKPYSNDDLQALLVKMGNYGYDYNDNNEYSRLHYEDILGWERIQDGKIYGGDKVNVTFKEPQDIQTESSVAGDIARSTASNYFDNEEVQRVIRTKIEDQIGTALTESQADAIFENIKEEFKIEDGKDLETSLIEYTNKAIGDIVSSYIKIGDSQGVFGGIKAGNIVLKNSAGEEYKQNENVVYFENDDQVNSFISENKITGYSPYTEIKGASKSTDVLSEFVVASGKQKGKPARLGNLLIDAIDEYVGYYDDFNNGYYEEGVVPTSFNEFFSKIYSNQDDHVKAQLQNLTEDKTNGVPFGALYQAANKQLIPNGFDYLKEMTKYIMGISKNNTSAADYYYELLKAGKQNKLDEDVRATLEQAFVDAYGEDASGVLAYGLEGEYAKAIDRKQIASRLTNTYGNIVSQKTLSDMIATNTNLANEDTMYNEMDNLSTIIKSYNEANTALQSILGGKGSKEDYKSLSAYIGGEEINASNFDQRRQNIIDEMQRRADYGNTLIKSIYEEGTSDRAISMLNSYGLDSSNVDMKYAAPMVNKIKNGEFIESISDQTNKSNSNIRRILESVINKNSISATDMATFNEVAPENSVLRAIANVGTIQMVDSVLNQGAYGVAGSAEERMIPFMDEFFEEGWRNGNFVFKEGMKEKINEGGSTATIWNYLKEIASNYTDDLNYFETADAADIEGMAAHGERLSRSILDNTFAMHMQERYLNNQETANQAMQYYNGLNSANQSDRMSSLYGMNAQTVSAKRAQFAFDKYDLNPETYAEMIASIIPFDAKEVQDMMKTAQGREDVKKLMNDSISNISSVFTDVASGLLGLQGDDWGNIEAINEAAANAEGEVKGFLDSILMMLNGIQMPESGIDLQSDIDILNASSRQERINNKALDYFLETPEKISYIDDDGYTYERKAEQSDISISDRIANMEAHGVDKISDPLLATAIESDMTDEEKLDYANYLRNGDMFESDVMRGYVDQIGTSEGLSSLMSSDSNIDMQVIEQLKSELPSIQEAIDALNSGNIENVEEAMKNLNLEIGEKATESANKFNKNASKIAAGARAIAEGGEEAVDEISKMTKDLTKMQDQKLAIDQFKGGKRSAKGDKILADMLGFDEKQFKNLAKDNPEMISRMLDASSDGIDSAVNDYAAEMQAILNDAMAANTITIDGQNLEIVYPEGATVDFSDFMAKAQGSAAEQLAAMQEFANSVNAKIEFKVTPTADGGQQLTAQLITDGLKMPKSFSGGGGKGGGGGGKGGKRKSAADKLIEKYKHWDDEYKHKLKMIQTAESGYQDANRLDDYGKQLQAEIELEKSRLDQINYYITNIQNQMRKVKSGSDDWYKLRDALFAYQEELEETNNTIAENTKKIKENRIEIAKTTTDVQDALDEEIRNRIDAEKDQLAGRVDMEDTILEAIKQRYQDEWDLIQEDIERKKKALQEEINLIDERLAKRKNASEQEKKYKELEELQYQLSMISMDQSRTKQAAELREKIQNLQEELAWTKAESEAEYQKNVLQQESDAMDEYVEEGQNDLDDLLENANNFSEEVDLVMGLGHDELMSWLMNNVQDYQNSLESAQQEMIDSWEDTFNQIYDIVETYWDEIADIMSSKDSFMQFMQQNRDYVNSTDEKKKQLDYENEELYDAMVAANTGTGIKNYAKSDLVAYRAPGTGTGTAFTYKAGDDVRVVETEGDWTKVVDGNGNVGYVQSSNIGEYDEVIGNAPDNSEYLDDNEGNYYLNGGSTYMYSSTASGKFGKSKYIVKNSSKKKITVPSGAQVSFIKTSGGYALINYGGKDGWIKNSQLVKGFAEGGLVDFTGPALVHGSYAKPEAFLSADDTKLMRDMLDAASMLRFNPVMSNITPDWFKGNSQNIGEINITLNEAQINTEDDYQTIAERIGDAFVKELSKSGLNMSAYAR